MPSDTCHEFITRSTLAANEYGGTRTMNQIRPENLAVRVKTDVHAPSPLRVIGPVTNMVPFYEAIGVKPGDKMFRADSVRVKTWWPLTLELVNFASSVLDQVMIIFHDLFHFLHVVFAHAVH